MTAAAPALPLSAARRALRLSSARLVASGSWRFAKATGFVLSFWLTLAVAYLAAKGLGHEVHAVVARTAVWIAWIGGSAVALWSAGDRAKADHLEGIDLLARTHGIGPRTLALSRLLATALRVAALVLLTCLPVAFASLAASPTVSDALMRLLSLLPLVGFALSVGLVAGPLAGACGWFSPRHGRSWLIAIVLFPWSLDGLLTASRAQVGSIPGALGYLVDLVTKVGGA
jgi:hypothetical protein